jgi:hypothetical protein
MLCQVLAGYHDAGFELLFATGRTLQWGMNHLEALPCSFYIAAYNGAICYKIPDKKVVFSSLLRLADLMPLAPFIEQFGALIYEGLGQERIFYTPKLFPQQMLEHVHARRTRQNENFIEISSIQELPDCDFASVRLFALKELAEVIGKTVSIKTSLNAPTMKDSLNPEISVVQITSKKASKGQALAFLQQSTSGKIVAAGDDMNDIDMLQMATVAIAMHEAPESVKNVAAIIAPPFFEDCIIGPLQDAVGRL